MKQESQSPENHTYSRKTDAVRDFFTAMLATVAVLAAGFGIFEKVSRIPDVKTVSIRDVREAKSTFREFAQAAEEEPMSSYEMLLAELDAGNTPTPDLYVEAAKELLNRGAGSDAKAIIQSGVIAHPDSPVVALGSIDVRAATGEADSAWTELAQTGDTANPEVMSRLIKYATSAGKVDETMTILGDLQNLPWTPDTQDWSNLVNMLTEAGRIEEAKEASQLSPESAELAEKLDAIDKLNSGDYEDAKDILRNYIDSVETPTPEDWALLAEAYVGLGDTEKADDAYREAEGLKKQQAVGGGLLDFLAGLFGGDGAE